MVFLLLGAIVNVAVAWTITTRVPMDSMWTYNNVRSEGAWQPFDVLGIEREGYVRFSKWQRFGSMHVSIHAGRHQRLPERAPSGDPLAECPRWFRGRIFESLADKDRIIIIAEARGWPAYSLWTEPARMNVAKKVAKPARGGIVIDDRYAPGLDMYTKPTLPLIPILPGFAINTVFYAVILWGGWLLFAAPFALRRRRRMRRGLCPACAYPVGDSPVCTECGKPLKATRAGL
jgi:hypothetical protein